MHNDNNNNNYTNGDIKMIEFELVIFFIWRDSTMFQYGEHLIL